MSDRECDCVAQKFDRPMPHVPGCPARRDPRNNPDDAYAAFMGMGDDEWLGLLMSIVQGGVLEPAEQIGFERALNERKSCR
jgi:hypothetical protein